MAGSKIRMPRAQLRALLLMATLGWLGVATLIFNTSPTALNQIFFFTLLFIALLSTISPLVAVWHARFTTRHAPDDRWRVIREGALVSLFIVTCLWLQVTRSLDWTTALLMFGAIVLIEAVVLIRRG